MTAIKSDMAGTLLELRVKVGDMVQAGQEVAIVESMKMEVPLTSSLSGRVTQILKQPGDFVGEGEVVLELG